MVLTPERLTALEQCFGGLHHVPRKRVSPLAVAPRYPNMQGGDRMSSEGRSHGYAQAYADHLQGFIGQAGLVIVEVGILKGSGLAIWSKLFPDADLIGLDIDLSNFDGDALKALGAFERKQPELYEIDQFTVTAETLAGVLQGRKVSISIDDGFHSFEAAERTLRALEPHLAERFVHFIEDMTGIEADIQRAFTGYSVEAFGDLTVVKPHDVA